MSQNLTLFLSIVAGVILGVLSNWLYDILRNKDILPGNPSAMRVFFVFIAFMPFLLLVALPSLREQIGPEFLANNMQAGPAEQEPAAGPDQTAGQSAMPPTEAAATPTARPTSTPAVIPTATPLLIPTATIEPEIILYAFPDKVHLGDQEFPDWPALTGKCLLIGFTVDDPFAALTLHVEALRTEEMNPILLNDNPVTILPPIGERFGTDWSDQTIDVPIGDLHAGANTLKICSKLVEGNPDFAGDIDDFLIKNIALVGQRE